MGDRWWVADRQKARVRNGCWAGEGHNLATLDLDLDNTSVKQMANVIAATVKEPGDKGFAHENETYVANDLAYISRLVPNNQIIKVYSREERELTNAAFHPEACLVGDV